MRAPLSSLTISIPKDHDELRQRVRAAKGFPILKLKLGTDAWTKALHKALP